MISVIKRFCDDRFIRNNAVFFCGSMAAAFLNYLYYPILGRTLKVAEFGELQAFISLTIVFGAFAGIFKNVIVNVVSNDRDGEGLGAAAALKKAGVRLSLAIALAIVVLARPLAAFLNLREDYLYPALAAVTVLGVSFAAEQAVIQGIRDFKALSISGIIYSAGRIIFSFFLVWFGLDLLGAVGGVVLAQALALVYAFFLVRNKLGWSRSRNPEPGRLLGKEMRYVFLVFAAALAVAFMYSGDMIVIKKLFSPEEAGLYGGIATVGRIVFFAAGSVAAVLFSSIRTKNHDGENARALVKAILLTVTIGGAFSLTFALFPDIIITILIGRRYLEYARLLPMVGIFLFFVSLANLFFFYLLALRDRFVFCAAAFGPLAIVGLCYANHGSVSAIVADFLGGSAAVLVLLASRAIIDLKRKRRYEPVNLGSDTVVQ